VKTSSEVVPPEKYGNQQKAQPPASGNGIVLRALES